MRIGYYGAVPNQQFEYDHKDDAALYLDQEFVQRKLRVLQVAYEQVKEIGRCARRPCGGMEERLERTPFVPDALSSGHAASQHQHQHKLQVSYDSEAGQIANRYIKGRREKLYDYCVSGT